ncbi:MAG TPA: metal ABC transporter permease [Pseudonocardiaceae bacterium]
MSWPPFLLHALLAGTAIAAAAGLVGYFVVLRSQVFTGDALSHVAFTGALAALAIGIDQRIGLFVATIGVGIALGALGGKGRADDVVIGSVFAWILGLGVFFLSVYTTTHSTEHGNTSVTVLFGSIFGLTLSQALVAALVAAAVAAAILVMARPLLFASIDGAVAAARGIPVRLLGYCFLATVGATAAEASQAVGALLLLGLLAAPAGTAQRLTTRPYLALALSAALAVGEMWAGLGLSVAVPALPPSSAILAVAGCGYALALLGTRSQARITPSELSPGFSSNASS